MEQERDQHKVVLDPAVNKTANESELKDRQLKMDIERLHNLRKRIDGMIFIVHHCSPVRSMEKTNAHQHLTLVKGWMGDILGYLGQKTPNNTSDLHDHNDIESDTDVTEGLKVQRRVVNDGKEGMEDANEIESICHVRGDLNYVGQQIDLVLNISQTVYESFIFQHLREAKFWLDQELFRIKESTKQKLFSETAQGKKQLPQRPEKTKPILSKYTGGKGRTMHISGNSVKKENDENNK